MIIFRFTLSRIPLHSFQLSQILGTSNLSFHFLPQIENIRIETLVVMHATRDIQNECSKNIHTFTRNTLERLSKLFFFSVASLHVML